MYLIQDIEKFEYISYQKHCHIFLNLTITIIDKTKVLPIPFPICKYNTHMRESDINAKSKLYYSADI